MGSMAVDNNLLTRELNHAMDVREVRCPGCGHLKFKQMTHTIELKCRCKTLFRFDVRNGEIRGVL